VYKTASGCIVKGVVYRIRCKYLLLQRKVASVGVLLQDVARSKFTPDYTTIST
jgi:hypothetical protein